MSEIPSDLKYTESHEWVRVHDDGTAIIGITDHAQHLLGDIVYTELPDVGANFAQKDECAVVESVKSAEDLYMPLSGEIIAINEKLAEAPELINQDPYKDGWMIKCRMTQANEVDALLDKDGYAALANADA